MHDAPGAAGTTPDDPLAPDPPAPPRQRWRLVVARSAAVADTTQREVAEAWEAALGAAGLPIARAAGGAARPRIAFAAPLPNGVAAEAEPIDVLLTVRWPIWQVREAVMSTMPDGWRLVDLMDIWLMAPPLPGQVVALDYRITLDLETPVPASTLATACAAFLTADRVERERAKGSGTVRYDLRPLVSDVTVLEDGPPIVLRTRTRSHPERGIGRPEEVVAALAASIDRPLEIAGIVRERVLLSDEPID